MNTAFIIILLINALRYEPLVESFDLTQKAEIRAEYLCTHAFSHDGFEKQFINYIAGGENLSKGFTPIDANIAWINSPSHYRNMVNPMWNIIGIGEGSCGTLVTLFAR